MNNQLSAKQKTPAIRADPEQTALLKAAYTVSYNPPLQTIQELSQQTGLPPRWISNWFGRQRSKSRKAGEVIDMTASSSVSTNTTHLSTSEIMSLKIESRETLMASESPSSPPHAAIQEPTAIPGPTKIKAKATRRTLRGKPGPKVSRVVVKPEHQDVQVPLASISGATAKRRKARPPQLLPSATRIQSQEALIQSRFPIPPPARSREHPDPQTESIYPQNTFDRLTTAPITSTFSSTGHFSSNPPNPSPTAPSYRPSGPFMRTTKFRHSMPNDYFSDPVSAEAVSPYQDWGLESQRASSPASSGVRDHGSNHARAAMNLAAPYETPFAPAVQEALSGSARNLPAQALAAYMALNNDPTVFRAMLLNYATLFPTLLPAVTGLTTTPPYHVVSRVPDMPVPALLPPLTDGLSSADLDVPHFVEGLKAFPISVDSQLEEPWGHSDDYPAIKKEDTWNAGSDYLDLSGLHYDYAPFSHLQERLEPFRLPESEYLFGREGVVNHLLDERLAVEEPFQAAMGLVLLSKLGLEW